MLPEQLLSPPYELRTEMNWIDFSGTANPLGNPAVVLASIQEAFSAGEPSYPPDREAHTLRSVLARRYGMPVESFLCGSTVGDMIRAVAADLPALHRGRGHAWTGGVRARSGQRRPPGGRDTEPVGLRGARPQAAARHGISFDAAVLANPGYPTSRLLPQPTLLHYLETCAWVVVDERSIELTLGGESMVPLTRDHRNLVVVRSLCESFAMPGVPVSYCVAHPDTIAQISAKFLPFRRPSPCSPRSSASSALAEQAHLERTREFLDTEIPSLQCMLNLIPGITIYPAEANYVMCSFENDAGMDLGVENADELASRLQLAGFLIRKLEGIPGLADATYFCVAVRTARGQREARRPPCARSSARASGRALPTRRAGPVSSSAPFPCRARPRAAPDRGRPSRLQRAAGRFPFMPCSRHRPRKARSSSTCTACRMSAAMPAASPPEATTGVS